MHWPGRFPHGLICPEVTFLWRPPSPDGSDQRTLWMWVHPSTEAELEAAVSTALTATGVAGAAVHTHARAGSGRKRSRPSPRGVGHAQRCALLERARSTGSSSRAHAHMPSSRRSWTSRRRPPGPTCVRLRVCELAEESHTACVCVCCFSDLERARATANAVVLARRRRRRDLGDRPAPRVSPAVAACQPFWKRSSKPRCVGWAAYRFPRKLGVRPTEIQDTESRALEELLVRSSSG